jgi:hypothetical protein
MFFIVLTLFNRLMNSNLARNSHVAVTATRTAVPTDHDAPANDKPLGLGLGCSGNRPFLHGWHPTRTLCLLFYPLWKRCALLDDKQRIDF